MDLVTFFATSITLLWIVCFLDGNAVLELRLLLLALTKAACHLYQALLSLRRATIHFVDGLRYLSNFNRAQQTQPLVGVPYEDLINKTKLHFLEGIFMVCDMMPNLTGAALSLAVAFCHMVQGGIYILVAPLRNIHIDLLSKMKGEKERWDKERHASRERDKTLSKELEYLSVLCQDPVSTLHIKVAK